MYRCPRCNVELPANARFCNRCGFNQTNARMTAVASQPDKPGSQPPTSPSSSPLPPGQAGKGPSVSPSGTPGAARPVVATPKGASNPSIPTRPSAKMKTTSTQTSSGQQAPMAFIPESPAPASSQRPSPAKRGFESPIQKIGPAQPMPKGTSAQPSQQPPRTPAQAPQAQPGQPMQPMSFQPAASPASHPQQKRSDMARGPVTPNSPHVPRTPQTARSVESLAATSKAAERWRNSWIERQRAEAGPAVGISRGQAVVPEPLLVMQQSFARMRAVILNQNKQGQNQGIGFGFWFAIVMMFCLVVGLGTYVISTYLPGSQLQNRIVPGSDGPIPLLTIQNKQSTIIAGQTLHVHGDHFGAQHPITFYLNNTQLQIQGTTAKSNSSGAFDVALHIAPTTLAGSYLLEAVDNQAGKHAFANLQILPATMPTNTTALALLSKQGKTLTSLTFGGQANRGNPPRQDIVLHNNGNTALPWTATAIADNGVNWLIIDDANTGGQLNSFESITMGISILTTGLKSGPYTGQIVFTVNNTQQVILPVTLQLTDISNELVISPNPLTAIIQAGGTCLPDTSITLINLSGSGVNWDVKGDGAFNQQHIHFDAQIEENNTLLPGDTKVIKITCIGVQLGMTYPVTVYYNGQTQHILITIRTA